MSALAASASLALILLVLWDAFEAVLLPRRVTRHLRISGLYYVHAWRPWAATARRMRPGKWRNTFLSAFGPLSVIVLIGLWATGLIAGFGLLHWSLGSRLTTSDEGAGPGTYLYLSGTTFFTLGFGDVTPVDPPGRALAVAEAGLGFGFLAVVISYLPVLYQAFSAREVTISLLDARAGSPPTAAQLLIRAARGRKVAALDRFLGDMERWAAAVLESHVSFPMLSYFRSQHDNQSWLAALAVALDASALALAVVEEADPYQAGLTFAMARHAVVDLAQVYDVPPEGPAHDRLPEGRLRRLGEELRAAGLAVRGGAAADRRLAGLRGTYEPFLAALSRHFLLVVKVTIGRKGRMHGVEVGGSMGLTTWAAFSGGDELAAVDGDFIMTAGEVQPVLRALRGAGIHVVALHNHMIGEEPNFYFTHFWGKGEARKLAEGLRSVLDAQEAAGRAGGHD